MSDNTENFFAALDQESDARESFQEKLHERNKGILPAELSETSVLIVGAGSVGSYMAEKLVRAGVGEINLVDPDKVETHNLTRSTYKAADVGEDKVEALKAHLLAINPYLIVGAQSSRLEDMDKGALRKMVERAHLIVGGADSKTTQAILNRIAAYYDKPLISPGLYKGAKGGEVVLYVPKLTPCLQCTLAGRDFGSDDINRQTDYGTGRLEGEIALGADIHFVTGAAVKMTLSMLSLMVAGDDVEASRFIKGALAEGNNYLLMSMTPDYWIFPEVFGDTPAQYAFQSLWLSASRKETCEICGKQTDSSDPISEIAPRLSNRETLLKLAEAEKSSSGKGQNSDAPSLYQIRY